MTSLQYIEVVDCPTCSAPVLVDQEYISPAEISVECRNCLDVSQITL